MGVPPGVMVMVMDLFVGVGMAYKVQVHVNLLVLGLLRHCAILVAKMLPSILPTLQIKNMQEVNLEGKTQLSWG